MTEQMTTPKKPRVTKKILNRRPVTRVLAKATPAPDVQAVPVVPAVPAVQAAPATHVARAPRLRIRDVVGSAPVACALLAALVVWCGAFAYAARLSPTYESVAVVSFAPRDAVTTGAETMILVVPKYVELLGSPAVLDRAAQQLGVEPEVVRARAAGVIEPNTLNLRIEVHEGDPEAAAETAAVLAAGVVQAAGTDPLVSAELVAPAAADPLPMAPTPAQVRLLGLALGAAAGLLVALSLARRRRGWQEFWGTVAGRP